MTFNLNQTAAEPFTVSGESMAEKDDGPFSSSYAIIVEFLYRDGTKSRQFNIPFPAGAHDWMPARRLFLEKKPVSQATLQLRYGNRTGKACFRNISIVSKEKSGSLPDAARAERDAKLGRMTDFRRDYHIYTDLVIDGAPKAAILGDAGLASPLVEAIRAKTGVTIPVVSRDPGQGNLIAIGSRDRNAFVSDLYTRHYTLLDGKYPGKGGNEVRSLHNIFGDGRNIITAGGSDLAGDRAAVARLAGRIKAQPSGKNLRLGFIADVTLSPEYKLPETLYQAPTWSESPGYGNQGFFGWNILSKNLAMLYVTGDAKYAREFMRLAFPADKSVREELFKLDDEAFHDRSRPIVSVYHYRAIMMILYWDLVEENPAFSDADRAKVTGEFYRLMVESLTRRTWPDLYLRHNEGKPSRGDRHVSWEVCSDFALGRYFGKYYPGADSREALRISKNAFTPQLEHNLSDNSTLYFLASSVEPFQVYAALALGDKAVGLPMLKEYVRGVTMLTELDTHGEHAYMLRNVPAVWLLEGAYLAEDQALIRLLRTLPTDTGIFRLGQSWWPNREYPNDSIRANVGRWTSLSPSPLAVDPGPEPPFPREKVVRYMTYRWNDDNFLLADTMGGYSLREQPHQFAMFSARLRGVTLLRGHWNTMQFYANGQIVPVRRYYSEVLDSGSVGDYAWVTAKAASVNGFDWIRTWLARKDGFLLAVDRVIPLQDCRTAEFLIQFVPFREDIRYQEKPLCHINRITELETGEFAVSNPGGDYLVSSTSSVPGKMALSPWRRYGDHYGAASDYMEFGEYRQNLRKGEELRFVELIRFGKPDGKPVTAMQGDTAFLRLPEPARLQFRGKTGFELVMNGETFVLDGGKGTLIRGGRPGALNFNRNVVRAGEPKIEKRKPLWLVKENFKAFGLLKTCDRYIAFGDRQAAAFSGKGQIIRRFRLPSRVRSALYVPERKMYLFGCQDENLVAFDENGRELWRFMSVMHQAMYRVGDYYHKKAYPGIWSIAYRGGRIYAGSAGTIEILSPDGKLLERNHPNISCQVTMFTPADGRFLMSLGHAHWGLYSILDGEKPTGRLDVFPDKSVIGSLGVLRCFTEFPHGDFVGAIVGKQQRLAVWDRNLAMKTMIALGEGDSDAPVDLAVNGRKFVVATERMRGYVYDDKLQLLEEYHLPAIPTAVGFLGEEPLFGLADGRILRGNVVIGAMSGAIVGIRDGVVLDKNGDILHL